MYIQDIAGECGFQDINYFSRLFKRKYAERLPQFVSYRELRGLTAQTAVILFAFAVLNIFAFVPFLKINSVFERRNSESYR
jgi:hypothetical protein